jgi:hypothetical protein
LSWAID